MSNRVASKSAIFSNPNKMKLKLNNLSIEAENGKCVKNILNNKNKMGKLVQSWVLFEFFCGGLLSTVSTRLSTPNLVLAGRVLPTPSSLLSVSDTFLRFPVKTRCFCCCAVGLFGCCSAADASRQDNAGLLLLLSTLASGMPSVLLEVLLVTESLCARPRLFLLMNVFFAG